MGPPCDLIRASASGEVYQEPRGLSSTSQGKRVPSGTSGYQPSSPIVRHFLVRRSNITGTSAVKSPRPKQRALGSGHSRRRASKHPSMKVGPSPVLSGPQLSSQGPDSSAFVPVLKSPAPASSFRPGTGAKAPFKADTNPSIYVHCIVLQSFFFHLGLTIS